MRHFKDTICPRCGVAGKVRRFPSPREMKRRVEECGKKKDVVALLAYGASIPSVHGFKCDGCGATGTGWEVIAKNLVIVEPIK